MTEDTAKDTEKVLTGKHVLAITVSAFAVIIGVNLILATQAVTTFPGLEVKNSYVASQSFEARRNAQEALGWQVETTLTDNVLRLTFTGADGETVRPEVIRALLGRTTNSSNDQAPEFAFDGGAWSAQVDVGRGMWTLMLSANAEDGTLFEKRISIWVN